MAGDWIKMRSDLFTHPKVVRISSALKADTLRTVGGLMSAWCLFDAHSEDGRLDGYDLETLDAHVRWSGFAAAMKAVGWLDVEGESLVLPRFDTHNGQSAKRRAQDSDRKRNVRKESALQPDKKRTREEKRREELSIGSSSTRVEGIEDLNGDGSPRARTAVDGDPAQAIGTGVPAAKRLRAIFIAVQALDPALLQLIAEKFTIEEMALCAAELVLRKACMWANLDGDLRPDLHEMLASAATQQQMGLTSVQYQAIKTAATEVGINYIASTLRGRRRDAANETGAGHGNASRGASSRASGRATSVVERIKAHNDAAEKRDADAGEHGSDSHALAAHG